MIVSLDIEHIMLVSDIIYAIERRLHIGKAAPFAPLDYRHPLLQSCARASVLLIYSFKVCSVKILIAQ